MKKMTLSEMAAFCGIQTESDAVIRDVSTDSRAIGPETLFVALKGERFDANDFVPEVLEKGAAAVLCSRTDLKDSRVLYTADVRRAFLALAAGYRAQFGIPVVAVTGSVGKTTTKGMIACVLQKKFDTLMTEGNLNNDIGVPKMLLRLEDHHEAAVIEMGMNHFGEISALTKAVRPTLGVITNIGTAHIENLGSREGILKAKCEILDGMMNGSPLLVNGDNDLLNPLSFPAHPVIRFGIENHDAAVFAADIEESASGSRFTVCSGSGAAKAFLPVVGRHNIYDALAAVTVGLTLGFTLEEASSALSAFRPEGMRQQVKKVHGLTLIEDCYNANPDSMRASLSALSAIRAGRAVAVLGDMKELGSYGEKAHREIGEFCAEKKIDALFTFGDLAALCAEEAKKGGVKEVFAFDSKEELTAKLSAFLKAEDTVLFKASRSMQLEDIINALYKEWEV